MTRLWHSHCLTDLWAAVVVKHVSASTYAECLVVQKLWVLQGSLRSALRGSIKFHPFRGLIGADSSDFDFRSKIVLASNGRSGHPP